MASNFCGIIFSHISPPQSTTNVGDKVYPNARLSGGYRIATELRQLGWDIEVVDFFGWWSITELQLYLGSRITQNTKFIGFSQIFPHWTVKAETICQWIKQKYPHVVIICGSSGFPEYIHSEYIDYHIFGYAEHAIVKLFDYLFSNGPKPEIVEYNDKKIILANEHYLASPYRSPNIFYEDRDFLQPYEWVGIEFSRGCKFRCAYCNFPILGVKGDWTRDVESAELQLRDAYDRYGIQNYYISDETFNDRTEKITKFADVVEKLNFKPLFTGYIRCDLLHARPKDNEELLRMNFLFQFYGIESLNWESAKAIGKGLHPDKIKQCLIDTKKYFYNNANGLYRGAVSLIYGLPYDTEETINSSFEWLVKNWQQENIIINSLNINKPDVNDFNQKFNISKIGVNFESYGYKALSENYVKLRCKLQGIDFNDRYGRKNVYWKSDIMDMFKCIELQRKYLEKTQEYDFRLDNFSLAHVSSDSDIRKRLQIKQAESYTNFGKSKFNDKEQIIDDESLLKDSKPFTNLYIKNKLSLI